MCIPRHQPKHPSPTINNNVQLNVHKHYRRFPMTVHTILPAIGHPDHVPYIITFAFAGHGRRKKSLLLRINMYRSAVLPVNSSCDTITYFPLAQHAETLKLVLKKVQNSQNPFRYIPIDTPLKYTFNFTFTYLTKSIFSKNQLCVSSKI